jgi:hypothetical protein
MRKTLLLAVSALALVSTLVCSAKIQEWKDTQGNAFKAEAVEAYGPFALFRTASGAGKRLPWRALSAEDCVRFESQAEAKNEPAPRWADATGLLAGRLRGYLRYFEEVTLTIAKFETMPEPELMIVFYVENSASGSWDMITKSIEPYKVLRARHPGTLAAFQYGVNHGAQEHSDMALRSKAPWLLLDYEEQRRISTLFKLSPRRSEFAVFAVTRNGVPILGATNPDEAALLKFFAEVDGVLTLLRPNNPHSWPDRAHYLAALHAKRHAHDQAGPILVGDPLVPHRLKEHGIMLVEATIGVGADGKVTSVQVKEDGSIPAKVIPDLAKPLQRSAVFVPAVDKGQFVSGTYNYRLVMPP